MLRYLAFGSVDQARAYVDTYDAWDKDRARQAETDRLAEVFARIDLRVCDELSLTRCTRTGRPLRPRRRAA